MKPTLAKRIAILLTTNTLLFAGAVAGLRFRRQMTAPGSPDSTWKDVCFGVMFGMFLLASALGVACLIRCSRRPESEQDTCKWVCTLVTAAVLTLIFLLTILFCGPPSLPQGPVP